MSELNDPADVGADPNTVRELQKARADLKSLRDEMKAIRSERDSAITERDDAIKSRDGYKGQIEKQRTEYEAKISEATENVTKAQAEAAEALAARTAAANEAVIRAEAKAAATRMGSVAPDDVVRLIDLSTVKIGEDGAITGLDEVMTAAKEAKAYLFTEPAKPGVVTGNTQSTPAPKPGTPSEFNARTAKPEEVSARMRELGLRVPRNTGA